jgi:protein-L-isoaspartate(D-aspartate) O-methyltransferase
MIQDAVVKLTLDIPMDYEQARVNMLKQQIRTWDVTNDAILTLFYTIPREDFVPAPFRALAFADTTIPLAAGQSMMTPREEAKILQELAIQREDKILVLGIDSGFLLVLLAKLGKHVYYVDNELTSLERIKNKLYQYKIENVTSTIGNLYQGWQDFYPFHIIFLTGSLPFIPGELKKALTINGRLFAVTGKFPVMEATISYRLSDDTWSEKKLFETDRPRLLEIEEAESFAF